MMIRIEEIRSLPLLLIIMLRMFETLWVEHRTHQPLFVNGYYTFGKHHCLLGQMEDGRSYSRRVRAVGGKACNRVFTARLAASLGARSFRWYHEGCMAFSRVLTAGKS